MGTGEITVQKRSDVINELTHRLSLLPRSEDGDEDRLVGAGEEEIRDLETELGIRLPEVYRRFLRAMGHSAGPLFVGSDYSLSQRHRLRLRKSAERVIERTGTDWQLPDDAFVFLMHHGYQFLFFRLREGDDPPVYRFSDADDAAVCIAPSMSEFLRSRMEEHERIVHKYLANKHQPKSARA